MIVKTIIPATLTILAGATENNTALLSLDDNNIENKIVKDKNSALEQAVSENVVGKKKPTRAEIQNKIIDIVSESLGVVKEEVTLNASFINDLGADSLDTVELIMEFEKEFNIPIPDAIAEKIGTVGQAINYIDNVLNNSVILYSERKFAGNSKNLISDHSCYSSQSDIINNGLSSIIIPVGYSVTLYTETNYRGNSIKIDASRRKVKIKDLSKIKKKSNIVLSNNKTDWNDAIKSIEIKKNSK